MEAGAFERVYQAFRSSILTSPGPSAASSGGSKASIICRAFWSSPRSGATPRICPRWSRSQLGPCSAFSPRLAGTLFPSSSIHSTSLVSRHTAE